MRERGADIKDIGDRLMRNMLGMNPRGLSHISGEVIIVAHDLAPSDTASLDKNVVKGIVTAAGGPTSHAAIMARTLEIPAVMGVGDIESFTDDVRAVVLGTDGEVITEPSDEEWERYTKEAADFQDELKRLKDSANLEAVTKDGHHVDLFGNIGKSKDADHALTMGAQGIGLYRTEFLYMENDELPTEDVQFEQYKQVAESMKGQPVIIRTMDIGGDKELKCLDLPEEMNPFLGYRAIRISLNRPDIFKVQLRALLRASAFGDIHIMYPMIASVEEVKAANAMLDECKEELMAEGALKLSAPKSAEIYINRAVIILEDTRVYRVRSANVVGLRLKRTFRSVCNSHSKVEHIVLVLCAEDKIILTVFLNDIIVPQLSACPWNILQVENLATVGSLFVLNISERERMIVFHFEMTAVVIKRST